MADLLQARARRKGTLKNEMCLIGDGIFRESPFHSDAEAPTPGMETLFVEGAAIECIAEKADTVRCLSGYTCIEHAPRSAKFRLERCRILAGEGRGDHCAAIHELVPKVSSRPGRDEAGFVLSALIPGFRNPCA